MDHIIRILVDRLVGKGIEPGTIPAYIRNLFNIISTDTNLSLHELNRRMEELGWDDFELDDHTLQLIKAIFETDGQCSIGQGRLFHLEGILKPNKIAGANNPENQSRGGNYEAKVQPSS